MMLASYAYIQHIKQHINIRNNICNICITPSVPITVVSGSPGATRGRPCQRGAASALGATMAAAQGPIELDNDDDARLADLLRQPRRDDADKAEDDAWLAELLGTATEMTTTETTT